MNVVIVAGAFGALGRAVVAELASRGHCVAAVDKAEAAGASPAALVAGGIDLVDPDAVAAAYADVAERLGPVSGLVNVAGGFVWEPVAQGSMVSWDQMYAVNLHTAVV